MASLDPVMDVHGQALLDYFNGETDKSVLLHRNDGFTYPPTVFGSNQEKLSNSMRLRSNGNVEALKPDTICLPGWVSLLPHGIAQRGVVVTEDFPLLLRHRFRSLPDRRARYHAVKFERAFYASDDLHYAPPILVEAANLLEA